MNSHGVNRHPRAIIDLDALRHNYRYLKQLAGGKRLIAVVKADAYGHGAVEVARAIDKADAFAVASVGEAVALRQAGIEGKVLVMGGFVDERELGQCIELGLDPVLHHQFHLDRLCEIENLKNLEVWLKLDSGMGRLGFSLERTHDIIRFLTQLDTLGSFRLMTHLASADDIGNDFTDVQLQRIKSHKLDDYELAIPHS